MKTITKTRKGEKAKAECGGHHRQARRCRLRRCSTSGPRPGAIAETGAAVLIVRNVEPVPASPARSGARIPCLFFVRPAPRGGQRRGRILPVLDSRLPRPHHPPESPARAGGDGQEIESKPGLLSKVLPGRAGTGRKSCRRCPMGDKSCPGGRGRASNPSPDFWGRVVLPGRAGTGRLAGPGGKMRGRGRVEPLPPIGGKGPILASSSTLRHTAANDAAKASCPDGQLPSGTPRTGECPARAGGGAGMGICDSTGCEKG